jgi:N-acylneuraminate cytidylyltransferase
MVDPAGDAGADPAGGVLIVVPARGGSRGLPGKNLATVAGVSLVGRAVVRGREFVARNGLGGDALIVVDTDDSDIADEARRWGASVPFLRPASLAADDTSTADSLAHLIGRIEGSWSTVVLLQPTSALARAADVSECWMRYGSADMVSVVSTVEIAHPPSLALVDGEGGALEWWSGRPPDAVRRQGHAASYWPSGAVYVVDVAWFLEHRRFIGAGRTVGVPMSPARSVDIDEFRDLETARLQALFARDASVPEPDPGSDDVVDGAGDIRDTVDRVLARIDSGEGPSAVRLGGGQADPTTALSEIPAIRSMFGLPVLWDAVGSSREMCRAARMLGARVVGKPGHAVDDVRIESDWFDNLRNR